LKGAPSARSSSLPAGEEDAFCAVLEQHGSDLAAEVFWICAGSGGGYAIFTFQTGDDAVDAEGLAFAAAVDADGNLAASAEGAEGGALGGDGEAGVGVVEEVDRFAGGGVVGANFDGEGALSGGGAEVVGVEALADPLGSAEAVEAAGREDDGLGLPFAKLAETGVDVAAKFDVFEIGAEGAELRLAARTAATDFGFGGKLEERGVFDGDEGVAGIGALGNGGDGEVGREFGGQVFEAVDGEIDAAFDEGLFDLFGEHAFGADLGEGDLLQPVAGGADDLDGDFVALGAQGAGDVVRLPEGELRPARADADHEGFSGFADGSGLRIGSEVVVGSAETEWTWM